MTLNISQALDVIRKSDEKNISTRSPKELFEPRNYIMSLGGKRMRSIFCLKGYSLFKEDYKQAADLAYAIELFHNFTLVHDDIIDDANLRRGQLTVHKKYDVNTAILSGDVMFVEVYERLAAIDSPHVLDIIKLFSKTAREVCEGQSMDMTFEDTPHVSIEDYLKMIELKTAVLLGASLQLGALLAGASKKDQEYLYRFATNAGVSFQIQDDYLDVYGDPKTFGKKVGGDIIQGKKTYLYLRALDLLDEPEKGKFQQFYESSTDHEEDKVSRVRNVFDELVIPVYCQETKDAFFDLAVSHLDQVSVNESAKSDLVELGRKLKDRSS